MVLSKKRSCDKVMEREMYWLWHDLARDHASLLKVHLRVTCGRKNIGVHQYCNITPISALETPDQVTQRSSGKSLSEEFGLTGELGQELFLCPGAG